MPTYINITKANNYRLTQNDFNESDAYDFPTFCHCGRTYIGHNLDDTMGVIDGSKIVLAWAASALDNIEKADWVERYTIHADNDTAWCRALNIAREFYKGNTNPSLNNWRDLANAINDGVYKAKYLDNKEPCYTVTSEVLMYVEDKTPTWDEICSAAYQNLPELKNKKYTNSWQGYHQKCSDIISASELY